MGKLFLWVFFISASAWSADPPASGMPVNAGSGTYVPPSSLNSSEVQNRLGSSPAPTSAPANGPTNIGAIPTPDTIPAPSADLLNKSKGQYRNKNDEVNISKMYLDRYKHSVVRVVAKDLAGNELARAMGVGIGRNPQYIATPLSIVLGNSRQWADKIEITHSEGNKYFARVALIDEERNLVLLAPDANPAPINFVSSTDERPQITVYTISFENGPTPGALVPKVHTGQLAAANTETGVLSVSGTTIDDSMAGSGLINSEGRLVGMLLPGGRGVLSSMLQSLILKANKSKPMEPGLIGAILGRGVLVDKKADGAFPSIDSAIQAIKKGEAPKADPERYIPAKSRILAPKEADKVVIKVMPGTYREGKPISLPSDISLSGSGPENTLIIGTDPEKPVLLIQNSSNVIVSGIRFVPAPLQKMKAPTAIVSKGQNVTFTGNIIEAKSGVGVWAHESKNVTVAGNSFPKGGARGISCDNSQLNAEANAFIGDWPFAIFVDNKCALNAKHNLFFENKTSIIASALAGPVHLTQNTFIRNPTSVKINAATGFSLVDNLFFESPNAVYSNVKLRISQVGRNAVWRSKFFVQAREIKPSDLVRTEPAFENPAKFDFRIKPGKAQLGVASSVDGGDLGAYQRLDFVGPYTPAFLSTLSVAIGEPNLGQALGIAD